MKQTISHQYREIINQASFSASKRIRAPEGWVRTVRKALNMSGAQLARRAGVTRARISQAELSETEGSMTLKQLQRLAESMECDLVYAIVPKTSVDNILENRAKQKAAKIVRNASVHMSLEAQALPKARLALEVERVAAELLAAPDRNFWND